MDVVELVNKYGFPIVMAVGIAIGYEWAWRPVVNTFRPLVG